MPFKLDDLLAPETVALVLTEVQDGVVGPASPWPPLAEAVKKVGLVANAARLAEAARACGAPVVHCTAEGLPGGFGASRNARLFGSVRKLRTDAAREAQARAFSAPCADVWRDGDVLLPRYHGLSAMTGSPLDLVLRHEGITTLIVAGVSLSFGVLSLVMDAVNHGYQVVVPRDAVAGFPEDYAQMVLSNTLSMIATISCIDDIVTCWRK